MKAQELTTLVGDFALSTNYNRSFHRGLNYKNCANSSYSLGNLILSKKDVERCELFSVKTGIIFDYKLTKNGSSCRIVNSFHMTTSQKREFVTFMKNV